MKRTEYVVPVRLDAATFRRFCVFDTLRLRRRWVRPAVFALILSGFAAVALLSGRDQAGLIAAVLLAVGLGLPLVYIGSFLAQVNRQAALFGLDKPRTVYTVTLNADGVGVTSQLRKEPPVQVPWPQVQAAFRRRDCIYLYVNAARAFLLPAGQGGVSQDELWAYLQKHMGPRCH